MAIVNTPLNMNEQNVTVTPSLREGVIVLELRQGEAWHQQRGTIVMTRSEAENLAMSLIDILLGL